MSRRHSIREHVPSNRGKCAGSLILLPDYSITVRFFHWSIFPLVDFSTGRFFHWSIFPLADFSAGRSLPLADF
jgi:hypothetical protein